MMSIKPSEKNGVYLVSYNIINSGKKPKVGIMPYSYRDFKGSS